MVKMGAREFVYPNFGYRSRWLRNRDPVYNYKGIRLHQPLNREAAIMYDVGHLSHKLTRLLISRTPSCIISEQQNSARLKGTQSQGQMPVYANKQAKTLLQQCKSATVLCPVA